MSSKSSVQRREEPSSASFHILSSNESRTIYAALNVQDEALMEKKTARAAEGLSQVEPTTQETLTSLPLNPSLNSTDLTQSSKAERHQLVKDSTTNPRSLTPSDRIRQLNELDARIPALLQAASEAIGALAPASLSNNVQSPVAIQQAAFKAASSAYFKGLSQIDRELRRQIYALEAAGIIPAEIAKKAPTSGSKRSLAQTMFSSQSSQSGANAEGETESSTSATPLAGGVGNLDIGWLNSRNGLVEKEMEAELWADAEKLVRRMEEDI